MLNQRIQNNFTAYLLLYLTVLIGTTMASVRTEKTTQLSSKRAYFSTIQANDRIFFIGGFERNDYIASSVIDVYNVTSGAWDKSLNLTSPRGRISPEIIGPRIYMVGGYDFNAALYTLNTETQTFTSSSGFTNRPTVRSPVSMLLSNTTLTVVGYHSVDFMDLATKKWTHNENLTNITLQLFNKTIVSIRNFVFVMGGIDGTSLLPSASIWMINSTTSVPIQFPDKFPVNTMGFVGSWFDDNHNVAVIKFANRCFVYHAPSQNWYQKEATNNTIASVSFLNSTIVFFSDGYWTFNWTSMSSAWTSLNQVNFAFTIADQLVYGASNQVSIVTSSTTVTQSTTLGPPLRDVAMSSTIRVFLDSTGALFVYTSATKQLVLVTATIATGFTPSTLFRINDTTVYIIGVVGPMYWVYTLRNDGLVSNFSQIPFIPDVLVQNYFYQLGSSGQYVLATSPKNRGFGTLFVSPIWTQLGDAIFVIETSQTQGTLFYKAVDVYNYIEDRWEDPIPLPKINFSPSFLPTAVLQGSLCLFGRLTPSNKFAIFRLNETGLFDTILATGDAIDQVWPEHPTYLPTVVRDNSTAYLRSSLSTAMVITSLTGVVVASRPIPVGFGQQIVKTDSKIVMSILQESVNKAIYIYNVDSNTWRSISILNTPKLVSIVGYDNYLLMFGDQLDSIDYLDLTTEQWSNQLFNAPFVPASLFTIEPIIVNSSISDNETTLVIAGGYHKVSRLYTDEVQFVSFDLTPTSSPIAIEQPLADPQIASPIVEDNSTIIIAIVIPVVVVVIAAVLLTVLLVRRKRQQEHSTMISMTGLEQQQFGQWFVPYKDITFNEQLGQGASGQVFKGKWKNTDVALKISMATANQSVMSELSMMIALRPHPNVVQLFGFSVHPDTNSVILILEYCNGGSLDLTFSSETDIDLTKQIYWLKSVCKGLGHLHSNSIVHRDIAARNVLLHQGEPKLTDFGLSRLVDEQQHGTTKSELGPIRWMAPESLRDKKYSPKSDVWSFGVLMFEVLERREPHLNEDPITIGMKIRDQGVIPQLSPASGYPSELISIMKQCCQMSPEARPTIDQVQERLERIPM